MKIDFGCGQRKTVGYVGVDALSHPRGDVVHDLNIFPYPFPFENCEWPSR